MWRHFDKHYLDSRRVAIAACILIFRKVPLQRLIAKGKRVRHGRCLSFTSPPETPLSHPKHPHSQRTWTISFTQSSSWKSFKLTSSCWCDAFLSFLSFPPCQMLWQRHFATDEIFTAQDGWKLKPERKKRKEKNDLCCQVCQITLKKTIHYVSSGTANR